MAVVALVLFGIYVLIAFGWRTLLQRRVTGDSGYRGISGRIGSIEWIGGTLFVVALIAGVAAPVAGIAGLPPLETLIARPIQSIGITLVVLGIGATFDAQIAMGASWRIGVDDDERTELVTAGSFSTVRNPVFTAMAVTSLGLALIVPNVIALVGVVLLVIALQIQVRGVEEPYLARHHRQAWADYSGRVGRFVPGLGTIRHTESSTSREGEI